MMETGLTYTSTVVVSKENVAATMGSGDLNVFATPAMVALMENAAMNAVAGGLPEGSTTVGAMMNTTQDVYKRQGQRTENFCWCRSSR